MQFAITCKAKIGVVCSIPCLDFGFNTVEQIRKDAGVAVSLPHICSFIPCLSLARFVIPIDEEHARISGHFQKNCNILVDVKTHALNRFVELESQFERDENTNEVVKAWCELKLNKKRTLDAWVLSGYPLIWDI